jgi:hypothetical protein
MSPDYFQSRWSLLSTVITSVAIEGSPEFVPNRQRTGAQSGRALSLCLSLEELNRSPETRCRLSRNSESSCLRRTILSQCLERATHPRLLLGLNSRSRELPWDEAPRYLFEIANGPMAASSRAECIRKKPAAALNGLCRGDAHRSATLKQTPSSKPNDGKAVVFNNARSLGYLAIHATLHRPFYEESAW